MSDESAAEKLHYRFCGDPVYLELGRNLTGSHAVEMLTMLIEDPTYVAAETSPSGALVLRALTSTHLYTVYTASGPKMVVDALKLTSLEISGEPTHKMNPTIEVRLRLRDSDTDVVFSVQTDFMRRKQLDELLGLLPALRDAVV